MVSAPVRMYSGRFSVAGMMLSTIEKKISRLMPLPSPRSVICSPSHMMKMAPVVRKNVVSIRKPMPGAATAPGSCSRNSATPQPWANASPMVR